jgi:hypothetical protein
MQSTCRKPSIMKYLVIICASFLFFSCQKKIDTTGGELTSVTISSDAILPLACHSTNFVTEYPLVAGQMPPFRFTKTLYADTRVKTINMLSRAVPNYSSIPKQMYETIGTFTYGPKKATLAGTRQLWEYYRTTTGASARKSIWKKNISLTFKFNDNGYCYVVFNNLMTEYALDISYDYYNPNAIQFISVREGSVEGQEKYYYANNDTYGNTLSYKMYYDPYGSRVLTTYDYTRPRNGRNLSYSPTQNLISQEYSLLEVMQWLPQPTHLRKSISGEFYPFYSTFKVVQTQYYKNYVFNSNKNLVSYSYADNVRQKTTWFCK